MKPPATLRPTLHLQAEVTFELGQRRGKFVAKDQTLSVEVPTVTTGLALCRLVLSRVNADLAGAFDARASVPFKPPWRSPASSNAFGLQSASERHRGAAPKSKLPGLNLRRLAPILARTPAPSRTE